MSRIALPLAAVLVVSLAACSPSTEQVDVTTTPATASTTTSGSATAVDQAMPPTDTGSNPNLPTDAVSTNDLKMRSAAAGKQDMDRPLTPRAISERAPPPIEDPAPIPAPTQ